MKLPYHITVYSEEETEKLAARFAADLNGGEVIILNGNLGAGKTFFIKNIVKYFTGNNATSPTFALVNEYSGSKKIYHFDFYRINDVEELYDIGINDYLNDDESIIFIEWGNLFPEVLPKKHIEVDISINEDFSRKFEFKNNEERKTDTSD